MSSRTLRASLLKIITLTAGLILACLLAAAPGSAQQRALTAADYQHAEQFMGYNTTPLVLRNSVVPNWLSDERFTYRVTTAEGYEFILVDPAKGTRAPAFDHANLAAALSSVAGATYDAHHLPFVNFDLSADGHSVSFAAAGARYKCDLPVTQCAVDTSEPAQGGGRRGGGRGGRGGGGGGGRGGFGGAPPVSLSPDGKSAAFIKDYNLWVRDIATNKETQLTTDGVKDFGYATDNAGWTTSDRPILLWSPDSKKIATYQQDQRGVGEMYLVSTAAGHPELRTFKYPLPGDAVITTIQRVIINVDTPHVIRLDMPPDQHRSSLCDDVACSRGEWSDVQWNPDGSTLAFVSTSRDHKIEQLRIADAATGKVRDVLKEEVPTFYESGNGHINWQFFPATNEIIWFSERSNYSGDPGWGHIYLYDLNGNLKNQITTGDWDLTQITRVDEKNRVIYFEGVGREKGDPYFIHFYRIGFDGKNLKLLTPEDATHTVALSPSGRYFIDTYSKPEVPPVINLRDSDGKVIVSLEKADISRLEATGWKPPVPFTVKARDDKTDLYGLMFKPTNFDAGKKYPIINHIYPGPQTGSVGSRSFSAARGDAQSLAELGFIVIELDGMGTPWRSKKFHEAYFGDLGDNTLPDQVKGMKELAAKYPWIDIDRAGIYGHSGGGFATADAMFRYPDFFKVGISESGNHDNRVYEDDWGEKWQGLLTTDGQQKTNYDSQANQLIAKNLKGHLLLAHGTMDNNVPPNNTLLVVDALIRANKDFDLLLLPNQAHGYGVDANYMTRRRWDYFVRYLLGAEPPKEYEMRPPAPLPGAGRGAPGM
jgi:dipeptidyl aminopeptidase/acylaminoacyl peptidase